MDSHRTARTPSAPADLDEPLVDSSAPTARAPVSGPAARAWADTLPDLGAAPSPRAYSVAPPRTRSRFSIAPPTLRSPPTVPSSRRSVA